MTKQELIDRLVKQELSQSKVQAKDTIDFIFAQIADSLSSGSEVSLPGFGRFYTATQAAKSGTMHGKAWTSEAKQIPKFKASTVLKSAVE